MKEQNDKIPSCTKNRVDDKANTIWSFNSLCRTISQGKIKEISGNIEINLITQIGIVTGNIDDVYAKDENNKVDNVTILSKLGFLCRNNNLIELENLKDNINLINETSIITIKNATLKPWSSNTTSSFDVLYLFASDITGFSIGSV